MMKEIYKIINDTLKGPTGKYSRKSLTMFSSWIMAILTGVYITLSDYIINQEINKYAIEVFYGFLLLAGGTSAITVWDKIKNKNNGQDYTTEDTDPAS
jgi:hypothetical protein